MSNICYPLCRDHDCPRPCPICDKKNIIKQKDIAKAKDILEKSDEEVILRSLRRCLKEAHKKKTIHETNFPIPDKAFIKITVIPAVGKNDNRKSS